MKHFFRNYQSGFTLVELIVVIALIGALVVGLFAAIDPAEQRNRGRDTAVRNLAREYFGGETRFFTSKGNFSWGVGAMGTPAAPTAAMTTALINAGELPATFVTQAGANLASVLVSGTALANGSQDINVCFLPTSKSLLTDPTAIYTNAGAVGTNCKGQTAGTQTVNCYICFKNN